MLYRRTFLVHVEGYGFDDDGSGCRSTGIVGIAHRWKIMTSLLKAEVVYTIRQAIDGDLARRRAIPDRPRASSVYFMQQC